MSIHDCPTCPAKGNCPLEPYAPWLNEHETEVNQYIGEVLKEMQQTLMQKAITQPTLLPYLDDIFKLLGIAACISYAKTQGTKRTQTPIPDYLLKSFGEEG
uniref:Putative NADH-ubiquinone oxidoreductase n=1 Tax=viral metagenome TaxID=1070528 RepID=A0A6M3JGV2_9ZZZZ